MHLTKLELLGFKSFPFKTEILLDNVITCIVGPNGCGKTNILDAIRWVLGEQRTSLLRGEKMEEVIFNGTKELKPTGMAEVSLLIQNDSGKLLTEYNEVCITRRLYRSGESEYYLNRTPCRLKDIIDLFLDTGMGAHAYSVIQQEMIDSILSEDAEERRFLFEEASGISKYKKRKKAAERKLEATENDLLRIKDVIAEVQRQVNSLRRQSRKAKSYQNLAEELKELELVINQNQIQKLSFSVSELDQRLEKADKNKQELLRKTGEKENDVLNLKSELLALERELSELSQGKMDLSQKSYKIESEIAINKEKQKSLKEFILRSDEETKNLNSKLSTLKEELKQKEKALLKSGEDLKEKEKILFQIEYDLKAKQEGYENAAKNFEKQNPILREEENRLQSFKFELKSLEQGLLDLNRRKSPLTEDEDSIQQGIKKFEENFKKLYSSLKKDRDEWENQKEEIALLEKDKEAYELRLETLTLEKIKLQSACESSKKEMEFWEGILVYQKGYKSGVKAVLDNKEKLPGVIDIIANVIRIENKYISAIQSALGEASEFVICQDLESARNCIDYLKQNELGRATFLILDNLKNYLIDFQGPDLSDEPGMNGWANQLVQSSEEFKPVVDFLLSKTAIFQSWDGMENAAEKLSSDYTLVSLEGELFKPNWILEGGTKKGSFLLMQEEEIQKGKKQINELEGKLEILEDQIKVLQNKRNENINELAEKRKLKENLREVIGRKEIELSQLSLQKEALSQREKTVNEEKDELEGKIQKLQKDLAEKEKENTALQEKWNEIKEEWNRAKINLERMEKEREEDFKRLNQAQIEMVSLQGRKEQLQNDIGRVKEIINEIETNLKFKDEEKEKTSSEIEKIKRHFGEKEEELEKVGEFRGSQEKIIESKEEIKRGLSENLKREEEVLKSLREEKEEIQESHHQLQMNKFSVSSEIQKIKERMWEEYQVDLGKLPSLTDEETQIEEYKKKAELIRERIGGIGPVNVLALDEYRSQKERLDFLNNQLDDLLQAKDSLNQAIVTINQTARKLFVETFDKIKENFQKVFVELFEGGEADLNFSDGDDPLESFIHISVNPKGKRLLSLNQLSGGERALTAISLLFAIYLVKPSPFCILDEVDAPLDDANLVRFIRMIKKFSENTQFIIITHNKLTMEAADVLYGVTMEKSGVSKIVSVRLKREEEMGAKA